MKKNVMMVKSPPSNCIIKFNYRPDIEFIASYIDAKFLQLFCLINLILKNIKVVFLPTDQLWNTGLIYDVNSPEFCIPLKFFNDLNLKIVSETMIEGDSYNNDLKLKFNLFNLKYTNHA